jgi:decaprenylphospho-beta-D-ribofuranose 2-oxidase
MPTFDHKDQVDFLSFDGGVSARGSLVKPSQSALRELSDIEERVLSGKRPRITTGAGLSFGAPHFGSGVTTIDNSRFTEIIGYEDDGLLEVQAGASMAHIFNFLADKGRYLVTQPGYPSITLGGCIAVDVHGKNQLRDGNFREQVHSLKLYHPSRGVISASQTINKDVFELTCGGYGLTGHIISAKIRTRSLISPFMALYIVPVDDILDTPLLIEKAARENDFVVSWHDFSARGAAFGRGFLLIGKFVADSGHAPSTKPLPVYWPLNAQTRKGIDLACYSLPFNRLINVLYGATNRQSNEVRLITVQECLYPARTLRQLYYKMFGKAGFHESQLIVPVDRFGDFVTAVKGWLDKNELAVTLASAKIFKGNQHLLQFDGDGVCFALNFPRCAASSEFLLFLDELTVALNLTPYLVKDSRLPLAVVRHSYKEFDLFKERLRSYDRDRLYRSELSQRLTL